MRLVARPQQADGANERPSVVLLHRPKAEPMLGQMRHLPVDPRIRPLTPPEHNADAR